MIKWNDRQLLQEYETEMHRRLKLAGAVVVDRAKQSLNVQGNPSKASKKKGAMVTHSAPGEPPRWQTGLLKKSITQASESKTEERVGTNVKYAQYLETGTAQMAPRPYLRPALAQSQRKIKAILTAPIK